jgi:hypothetical protein
MIIAFFCDFLVQGFPFQSYFDMRKTNYFRLMQFLERRKSFLIDVKNCRLRLSFFFFIMITTMTIMIVMVIIVIICVLHIRSKKIHAINGRTWIKYGR